MQAIQLTGWQRPAELREVPRPRPGPGQVLLEVRGAGLCHSDLHLMHWPAGRLPAVISNWGTRAELAEVVALARDGVVHVEVERMSLAEAPAAYRRLGAGDVRGRLVAVPRDEA